MSKKTKSEKFTPLNKIFPFDINDKSTWPWLDHKVSGRPPKRFIHWVKNPEFKWPHLIPNY